MMTLNREFWIYTARTASFYGLAATSIWVGEYLAPTGPCTSGLGILLALVLALVAFIAAFKDVVGFFKGMNKFLGSILIHCAAIGIVCWYAQGSS